MFSHWFSHGIRGSCELPPTLNLRGHSGRLPPSKTSAVRHPPSLGAAFRRQPFPAAGRQPFPAAGRQPFPAAVRRLPPTSADFRRLPPTSAAILAISGASSTLSPISVTVIPTSANFRPPSTPFRRLCSPPRQLLPTSANFRPPSTQFRRLSLAILAIIRRHPSPSAAIHRHSLNRLFYHQIWSWRVLFQKKVPKFLSALKRLPARQYRRPKTEDIFLLSLSSCSSSFLFLSASSLRGRPLSLILLRASFTAVTLPKFQAP